MVVRAKACLVAALAVLVAATALGCGGSSPQEPQTVEVFAVIPAHGGPNRRFEDGRYIGFKAKEGESVRFHVITGGVEGFTGPIHQPKFYYRLLPVVESTQPPQPVEMQAKVTTKTYNWANDWKSYDLRPTGTLKPGAYRFLYDGAGSVQIDVFFEH